MWAPCCLQCFFREAAFLSLLACEEPEWALRSPEGAFAGQCGIIGICADSRMVRWAMQAGTILGKCQLKAVVTNSMPMGSLIWGAARWGRLFGENSSVVKLFGEISSVVKQFSCETSIVI